jgi:hypothetical protein
VHRLTIEKKIELQCSYATAMEKVLSDPANAALKREFARSPFASAAGMVVVIVVVLLAEVSARRSTAGVTGRCGEGRRRWW